MYGCEILFDADTAASVHVEVSKAMGGGCPFDGGGRCPLLPADLSPLLMPSTLVLNTREDGVAGAEPTSHPGPRLSPTG